MGINLLSPTMLIVSTKDFLHRTLLQNMHILTLEKYPPIQKIMSENRFSIRGNLKNNGISLVMNK